MKSPALASVWGGEGGHRTKNRVREDTKVPTARPGSDKTDLCRSTESVTVMPARPGMGMHATPVPGERPGTPLARLKATPSANTQTRPMHAHCCMRLAFTPGRTATDTIVEPFQASAVMSCSVVLQLQPGRRCTPEKAAVCGETFVRSTAAADTFSSRTVVGSS